ncbi:MAG: hypothetical protein EBZ89_07690 [Chloroflexi bacterium]|nr:hypothetical protein [Chloroflexota bacterium]
MTRPVTRDQTSHGNRPASYADGSRLGEGRRKSVEFAVSTVLWWIAGGAVLLAAYAWSQTRRARDAVPFPDVSLLRAAMATRPSTAGRRHAPAVLTVAALALAAVAIARPALRTPIPRERTTIVLVLDVSASKSPLFTEHPLRRVSLALVAATGQATTRRGLRPR